MSILCFQLRSASGRAFPGSWFFCWKLCSQIFFFKSLWDSQCRISRYILSIWKCKFQGNFLKEINLGIKMQRWLGKAFTFTFSQVLTVFWPGSTFPKSYLLLGVALLFVEWEGWGVGRCFTPLNVVDSMWFSFPGGPWGCCSDSWVHPRATGSKLSLPESLIYKIILLKSFSSGMKISLIRLNTGRWPMVFMIVPWILSL